MQNQGTLPTPEPETARLARIVITVLFALIAILVCVATWRNPATLGYTVPLLGVLAFFAHYEKKQGRWPWPARR